MFNKLVASGGKRKSFWTPSTVVASVGFHVLLVAGAYAANQGYDPTAKKADELVDFVEIEEEKKPEEPKPEEPKPEEPAKGAVEKASDKPKPAKPLKDEPARKAAQPKAGAKPEAKAKPAAKKPAAKKTK